MIRLFHCHAWLGGLLDSHLEKTEVWGIFRERNHCIRRETAAYNGTTRISVAKEKRLDRDALASETR